jgi:transposase
MQHIQGEERNQIQMFSLESAISPDSFVRVIDAFVDAIDLKSFGFRHVECQEEGRPPYHPAVLLKLYLYGYQNGIRTTRRLEREARLNIEVMWLLSGQKPHYHTISDFRKDYRKPFREIFRRFVYLLKTWQLIEGKAIAVDSFKIRAQNSLKNNYNEKKIERHLAYIDEKISEYQSVLDAGDKEEERQEIETKIEYQNRKKEGYNALKEQLKASGQEQISLTDSDAKAVVLHRNIVNVGYNIQASTDSKHKLLVEYNTGEVNDTHALSGIAIDSKNLLKVEKLDALADKGYHTGEEISNCEKEGITTYVSPRAACVSNKELYTTEKFTYDKETDTYNCPAGEHMQTNGNWVKHSKSKDGRSPYRFKRYTTKACKTCRLHSKCTESKRGRQIERSEYAEALERNNCRVLENPDYYKQRQQITEHIFGTLKRQRGFTHAIVKSKEKVLGEVGLMFIGYNLTRCATILGVEKLIKALKESCLHIVNHINWLILSRFNQFLIYS